MEPFMLILPAILALQAIILAHVGPLWLHLVANLLRNVIQMAQHISINTEIALRLLPGAAETYKNLERS